MPRPVVILSIINQKQNNMDTATNTVQKSQSDTAAHSPEHIMQIGMGFWASKTLLAAIKFRIFTLLATESLSGAQLKTKLGLHERGLYDFLDTLVALGFLEREGLKETAIYSNTPDTDFFLDKNKPSYIGGILEMGNERLYQFWGSLEDGLITGEAQNEMKYSKSGNMFSDLYSNPDKLSEFLHAMAGVQMGAFMAFAQKFDFTKYKTLCDAGGSMAALSVQMAMNQPHIKCVSLDLPPVEALAKANINKFNLSDRVEARSGDFFADGIPHADIIVMGNILHDWNEEEKLALIKKAYDSLPKGGAFVCIENIIDNDRRKNAFGLMMSLNMLIETNGGFDFTFSDFEGWAKKVGFSETRLLPLAGPTSAAIAYK